MLIYAIDPGPIFSGFIALEGNTIVIANAKIKNGMLVDNVIPKLERDSALVIEMIDNYGLRIGRTTMETLFWIGQFHLQSYRNATLIARRRVKMFMCGRIAGANDSSVRAATLGYFKPYGGGKTPEIGTKAKPGPLHGVKGHAMQALALAVTYRETGDEYKYTLSHDEVV